MTTAVQVVPAPLAGVHGQVRSVRVALAGCGTVGGALLALMQQSEPMIGSRFGVRFEIVRVLVRDASRPRASIVPADRITDRVDDLFADDVDVVVEAMGGVEPAAQIAVATLRRGAHFVTANKTLLAAHGPALADIARASGGRLGFEAAVGGGIPVIRTLRDALPWAGVRTVRGVLNGTSNFLLDRIRAGHSAEAALAEAQRLGFAEADPSRDLDGLDTGDKIAVLAWLAFGVDPATLNIAPLGIGSHAERLVEDGRAFGLVTRLVGECTLRNGQVSAAVQPVALSPDSPLATVREEHNLIAIDSAWNGTVSIAGPGAGGGPTASALLSDLLQPPLPPRLAVGISAGDDARAHPWILSVRNVRDPLGAEAATRAILGDAGVVIDRVINGHGTARFLTASVVRGVADRCRLRLVAAGLDPVMLAAWECGE
jgi:homoserine dehydrogenase